MADSSASASAKPTPAPPHQAEAAERQAAPVAAADTEVG